LGGSPCDQSGPSPRPFSLPPWPAPAAPPTPPTRPPQRPLQARRQSSRPTRPPPQPPQPTVGSTGSTTVTTVTPTNARCALSPSTGPAGSRVALACRGFAPAEPVAVSFGATVLTTAKATANGQVAASFAVPSGFAGSHYPGRKDTFLPRAARAARWRRRPSRSPAERWSSRAATQTPSRPRDTPSSDQRRLQAMLICEVGGDTDRAP
jgi:hypothetical protein